MYNHTVLERADGILEHCAATLQLYEKYNRYIEEEHSHNRMLFLRPVRMPEPVDDEIDENEKKSNPRFHSKQSIKKEKNIDPMEVAYEYLNCDMRYGNDILPSVEEMEFRRTHTLKFYKERRNRMQPDKSIEVNKVRTKGPNETRSFMTKIPNTSSLVGTIDTDRSLIMRSVRMRNATIENAQMTIKPSFKKVPNDLLRLSKNQANSTYSSPRIPSSEKKNVAKKNKPLYNSVLLDEINEIDQKIKKHEKLLRKSLRRARKTCESINRRIEQPIEPSSLDSSPRNRFRR